MKPWERYQESSREGGKPWEKYAAPASPSSDGVVRPNPALRDMPLQPVDDQAYSFLKNHDRVRAELHPRDLGQLDFGDDSPEIRDALSRARQAASRQLHDESVVNSNIAGFNQYRTKQLGRVAATASGVQNGVTLGLGDRINAGIDRVGTTLSGGETEGRDFLQENRETRGDLIDEFPIAYTAGEVAGFVAPGSVAFNTATKGAKAVGAATGLSRAVPTGGNIAARSARYGSRLAPAVAGGTADAALYGFTSASANDEARTGEDASLGSRLGNAKEYAPYGAAAAPLLSGLYRLGVRARTGQFTPNSVLRENAERGIAAGGGDAKQLVIDTIQRGGDVPRGTARSLLSVLDQSGLSRGDVMRGVTNAVEAVESGVEAGGRAPIFGDALSTAFKETPEVGHNIQSVLRQLQTSGPRQGNAPAIAREGLNAQAQSQQQHLRDVFSRELGEQNVFDERKALEATRAHEANQAYEQALRAVDVSTPKPGASYPQAQAITDLRNGLTEAVQHHKPTLSTIARERGHQSVDELIAKEPQHAAHDLQSQLRESNQYVDRQLGRDILDRLERASVHIQRGNGARTLDASEYTAARNRYREQSGQLEAADVGQKLLTKVKDGERADELLLQLRTLEPDARRLAALSIKESLENVFRNTNSDEVIKNLPTLNQLRKSGLHEFLEDALGEQGQRITRNIQQVLDERNFLVGARPERLGQKPNAGDLAEARRLYTSNPIARASERLSWQSAITADIGSSLAGIPLPPGTATGFKALGSALGPGKRTREGLARLLTESRAAPARPRQQRVPAAQSAVPTEQYRDARGRIQRGGPQLPGQLPRSAAEGVQAPLAARQARPAPERPVGSQGTQTREPLADQAEEMVRRAQAAGIKNVSPKGFRAINDSPAEQQRVAANVRTVEQMEQRAAAKLNAKQASMASQTEMIINEADALARSSRRNVKLARQDRARLDREAEKLAKLETKAREKKMRADTEAIIAKLDAARRATRSNAQLAKLDSAGRLSARALDIALKAAGLGASVTLLHVLWRAQQLITETYGTTKAGMAAP